MPFGNLIEAVTFLHSHSPWDPLAFVNSRSHSLGELSPELSHATTATERGVYVGKNNGETMNK